MTWELSDWPLVVENAGQDKGSEEIKCRLLLGRVMGGSKS